MTMQIADYVRIGVLAIMLLAPGGIMIAVSLRRTRKNFLTRMALVSSAGLPMPGASSPMAALGGLVRVGQSTSASREEREFARRLARWNIPAARATIIYRASRIALAILLAATGYLLVGRSAFGIALAAALAVLGWYGPFLISRSLTSKRAQQVVDGLPEALELMVVCVDAGLSLDDTLERVTAELMHSQPTLAQELLVTSADMKVLSSRDEALLGLARRVDAPSVRSMVMTLSQTMRYGTPLAQALRTAASEMRNEALLRLEERANMLPTLLTLPMMFFIMPTIFLIVGGPAVLRILDTFMR